MSQAAEEGNTQRDETAALLPKVVDADRVPSPLARRLYLSHTLSTWNSRVFEFGAVLYLATIYPGTLTPMSIYAFTRGICTMIFAPAVGQYIDTGDRLNVVRVSIVVQRLVVAISCALFYILTMPISLHDAFQKSIFAILVVLACAEKLCSVMNLVSVEKDWCVVVAGDSQAALRTLNAQMRRIDLLCKLLGPLFIAVIDGASTKVAIIVNFAMNLLSIPVEYIAIARVYHEVPALQEPKTNTQSGDPPEPKSFFTRSWDSLKTSTKKSVADFGLYLRHAVFLPSVAGALLYLTVLNFGGQMVTFLLASGYKSDVIGVARTLSVSFEVLATWFAPWLIGKIGPVRAGLWLSTLQVTPLIGGTVGFILLKSSALSATALVVGTIFSRLGLRGFDLSTQLIVQEAVEPGSRGAFSTVEAAWQNMFELLSYATTLVFYRPENFQWPVLISVSAVALASFLYLCFAWKQRGHLIHTETIVKAWPFSSRAWEGN